MSRIINWFNYWPLYEVITPFVIVILLWCILDKLLKGRENDIKDRVFLCLSVGAILFGTVFSRNPGSTSICVIPFYSFVLAKEFETVYRSILLNVCIFIPLGISLCGVLKTKSKWKTIVFAFLFSLLIESVQYFFCLGRAEIDDLIFNVLGAVIGMVIYKICKKLDNI